MYEIDKEKNEITGLKSPSFSETGFQERAHLQEWIDKNPKCLGEDLLIIQKEYAGFEGTKERLDLLALDKEGRLVVIENKRDDSGRDVSWQALKYVAYCSTLKQDEIIKIYKEYLEQKNIDADAEKEINEFLKSDLQNNDEEIILNQGSSQRFILVSANFRKEVTSTILWLIEKGIDAECIEVKLYESDDNRLFFSANKIIPIPNSEEYMIKKASKSNEERHVKSYNSLRREVRFNFWEKLLEYFRSQNFNPYKNAEPVKNNVLSVESEQLKNCFYELYFVEDMLHVTLKMRGEKEENKNIFEFLHKHKNEVEQHFAEEIYWMPVRQTTSRISCESQKFKGDNHNEENWDEIIKWYHANVKEMHKVFEPLLAKAKEQLNL